jgi:hypothetical protein
VLRGGDAEQWVTRHGETIVVERRRGTARSVLVLALGPEPATVPVDAAGLTVAFDSAAATCGGHDTTAVGGGTVSVGGPTAVLLVSA